MTSSTNEGATRFDSPFGPVTLVPSVRAAGLRPWDAADVYALRYLAGELDVASLPDGVPLDPLAETAGPMLVAEDATGALLLPLAHHAAKRGLPTPTLLADSLLAHRANEAGAHASGLPAPAKRPLLDEADAPPCAIAVVRAPRSVAYTHLLLTRLRAHLQPGALVVVTGMTKHLPPTLRDVFGETIGPPKTLRVWKKAVVLVAPLSVDAPAELPAPTCFAIPELDADAAAAPPVVCAYRGVFAGERLDAGTRLLLGPLREFIAEHAPARIADVGCGSGALALAARLAAPDADVLATDASTLAIASTQATFARNHVAARIVRSDGLRDEPDASLDLVVSNPPFHVRGALHAAPALRFIADAARVLRPGGSLLVVGVHRLGYAPALRKHFARVETVASNATYGVWHARSRGA